MTEQVREFLESKRPGLYEKLWPAVESLSSASGDDPMDCARELLSAAPRRRLGMIVVSPDAVEMLRPTTPRNRQERRAQERRNRRKT